MSETPRRNVFEIDPEKPFEHDGHHGCVLKAPHCNLAKGTVQVTIPEGLTLAQIAHDMLAIGIWWDRNILSDFPPGYGFPGTRAIRVEATSDPHPCPTCKSYSEKLEEANKRIEELEGILMRISDPGEAEFRIGAVALAKSGLPK